MYTSFNLYKDVNLSGIKNLSQFEGRSVYETNVCLKEKRQVMIKQAW